MNFPPVHDSLTTPNPSALRSEQPDDLLPDLILNVVRQNRNIVRVKNERLAVRNLRTILEATISLSIEMGFAVMSVRDLSRKTGFSMGALYSYFREKDQLLDMIRQIIADLCARYLEPDPDPAMTPDEKLEHVVRTHLLLTTILRPWFYVLYMEVRHLTEDEKQKTLDATMRAEMRILRCIEEGITTGVFRSDCDAQLTSAAIKAMLQDWYVKQGLYRTRQVSIQDYGSFIMDMVRGWMRQPLH